jgi:hypothetical protein
MRATWLPGQVAAQVIAKPVGIPYRGPAVLKGTETCVPPCAAIVQQSCRLSCGRQPYLRAAAGSAAVADGGPAAGAPRHVRDQDSGRHDAGGDVRRQ